MLGQGLGSEPVEVTWAEEVEVIWACEVDWLDTVRSRRAYMKGD